MSAHSPAEQPPAGLPVPPSFPFEWEQPEDARLSWKQARMHCPLPVTPLDDAFIRLMHHQGFNPAAAAYELPIRAQTRRINTYFYMAIAPLLLPPEELGAMGQRAEQRLGAALARMEESWEQEWLPEVQRHLAYWQAFDLPGASAPSLITHLDETVARFERAWEIHFLLAFPSALGPSLFEELYTELFGADDPLGAYRLLQGFDNKSLETDRALWALSRRALAEPAVRAILERHAAGEVVAALEASGHGQAFLGELRSFLEEFGRRTNTNGLLSTPSWIEEPTSVITTLKEYLVRPDRDLLAEQAALGEERERLTAQARERLAGYPQPVREQFEFLLRAARVGNVLSETHDYWIDYAVGHEVRRVVLELGRRLAEAGAIDHRDDVFMLTLPELRETAAAPSNRRSSALDRRPTVAERRAEIEHFRTIEPPPVLGTPPSAGPPADPLGRAIIKFFGGPPPPSDDPRELRGSPGSAGTVRGVARLVPSLAEAGRLRSGEILVTAGTQPAWTPLFGIAAAVVTDAGGVLSHCAVVAREYRIPAVVGTGAATATIRDGQLIEVDGAGGVVRLLD